MHYEYTPDEIERFWKYVDHSGDCWVWTGFRFKEYGRFARSRRIFPRINALAHRTSWEIHNGPIPDGLFVCHHCDNPPCVRPDHLFLGTNTDNMRDMHAKGRQGGRKVVNEDQVREIRHVYTVRQGMAVVDELAARYGVSTSSIWRIISRATWPQVE